MRTGTLPLLALLFAPALLACSDDSGTQPDLGRDQTIVDQRIADRGVDLGDAGGDATSCTAGAARCTGNIVERCDQAGTAFATETDCDALKIPTATFTCEECVGTSEAVCKASRKLFSGKVSGDVTTIDYSYEGQCGPLVVTAKFASGGFSHTVYPAGTADGGYPLLILDAPDLTKAKSGSFLIFSAGAGQNPPVLVTVSTGVGVDCKNVAPTGSGTPPGAGTATMTYADTKPGDTMSIVIDGWLTCDAGQSWKAFKYNASGIAF